MTSSNSGAVFFLGSRAHYQVLQQPESQSYDAENGNASTETIYRNPSARELTDNAEYGERNWNYEHDTNMTEDKEKLEIGNGVKRRTKRRQSETTLCEKDNDMKPALLNNVGDSSTPKAKARRRLGIPLFLLSLGRRRHEPERAQYLQHIESALACTYRGSCRCLDCQYLKHIERALACTYRGSCRCLDCQVPKPCKGPP
ncbi:uncharacterized protein LOC135084782 [Ostrinia nubilalis]|uniref:uncharacterized protein LOC135084782 n=1 Tax=Ostrinia nubilalis TaxID=29057 RepID=UPI0030823170